MARRAPLFAYPSRFLAGLPTLSHTGLLRRLNWQSAEGGMGSGCFSTEGLHDLVSTVSRYSNYIIACTVPRGNPPIRGTYFCTMWVEPLP